MEDYLGKINIAEENNEKIKEPSIEHKEYASELSKEKIIELKKPAERQNPDSKIEKRQDRIIKWLKDPYNLFFLALLITAISIRIHYFFMTSQQPLWWDEADYMSMAKNWAFGQKYELSPVRQILFPLTVAVLLKIANNEFLPRFMLLLFSILSVIGVYLLGKETHNKKVGLVAGLFMSVFYLNLFYSFRLLIDVPSLVLFTFAGLFFYKYFKTDSNKMLYIGAVIIALGTLAKLSTAAFLFGILAYLLVTEKLDFLKRKELYIAALIFFIILSPYIIWGYYEFGGFIITEAGKFNAPEGNYILNAFNNFKTYIFHFDNYLTIPLLLAFVLGLVLMYKTFLGFDLILKSKKRKEYQELKRDLYVLLILIVPLLVVSSSLGYFEDRYAIIIFPSVFIIAGDFVIKLFDIVKRHNYVLAWAIILLILGSAVYLQLEHNDLLIKSKLSSYEVVKQAGIWLRDNTNPEDKIIASSFPQINFYSDRETVGAFKTREEFELFRAENPDLKYYVISAFEPTADWFRAYPIENNMTVKGGYFADQARQQPVLIIYEL